MCLSGFSAWIGRCRENLAPHGAALAGSRYITLSGRLHGADRVAALAAATSQTSQIQWAMKVFLPLSIRVDNRKILFVGGGRIALHKIRTVSQYTRNITILAPSISEELRAMGFVGIHKRYEPSDLDGFFLVYACTNDSGVNRSIHDDCTSRGIMVNVVDNRELSDFISPAIIRKGEMSIAVSSNGQNVKKTVEWRNRLRDTVVNDWEESHD